MVLTGLPRALFDVLLYQLGWCVCILGAAAGRSWAGAAYTLLAVLAHMAVVPSPLRTLGAIAAVAVPGALIDGVWTALGWLDFPMQAHLFGLLPPWMAGLWVMFCFVLGSGLRFLRHRLLLAALIGLVGGPLAYLAGSRLGALELHGPAVVAVAITWAVVMPYGVVIFSRVDAPR